MNHSLPTNNSIHELENALANQAWSEAVTWADMEEALLELDAQDYSEASGRGVAKAIVELNKEVV